jgi:hypothetical protein
MQEGNVVSIDDQTFEEKVCSIKKWKPSGMLYDRYNSQMKEHSFEMQVQI